ncbi:MAG: hypothetical protein ACI32N_09605 [Bulleidia sp.]
MKAEINLQRYESNYGGRTRSERRIPLCKRTGKPEGDDPDGFTLFMKESTFSVCDDYRGSWEFIKTELHSLERYSNFGIELPPLSAVKAEQSCTV